MTFLLNYVNLGYGTRVQAENFGVKCCPTLCSLRGEFFVFEVPRTPMGLRHISHERLPLSKRFHNLIEQTVRRVADTDRSALRVFQIWYFSEPRINFRPHLSCAHANDELRTECAACQLERILLRLTDRLRRQTCLRRVIREPLDNAQPLSNSGACQSASLPKFL
jgi:hypothetical protein